MTRTSSQFFPLASSTQVIKSESTSENSDEDEIRTGTTVRIKEESSSDSDYPLSPNSKLNYSTNTISKRTNKIERGSKSKIHIIDNLLINSENKFKQELDSDSKSVVSVYKPISSYNVSSESDCENNKLRIQKQWDAKSSEVSYDSPDLKRHRKKLKHQKQKFSLKEKQGEVDSDSDAHEWDRVHPKLKESNIGGIQKANHEEKESSSDSKEGEYDVSISNTGKKMLHNSRTQLKPTGQNKGRDKDKEKNSFALDARQARNVHRNFSSDKISGSQLKQELSDEQGDILNKFLRSNKDYQKTKISKKLDISNLGNDDEVYLLQIPRTINPRFIQGLSFSLPSKSKLKTDEGKFVITPQPEAPYPILIYSNGVKRVKPLLTLKMEKYVRNESQAEMYIEESTKHILPDIKLRHPLLGSEYKSKIQLIEQIKEKLNQALQRIQVREKTSNNPFGQDETVTDNYSDTMNKKRKRKHNVCS